MTFTPALVTEEHPLELAVNVAPDLLALEPGAAKADQPIAVEVTVQKDGDNFIVLGWATTSLLLVCGRCAEWLPWPVHARVEHVFEAPHPNSIDLTPLIREDILLELPLNAACRLGADGRCPVTGELYQPRPESSGLGIGEEVWEALSKIKPKN